MAHLEELLVDLQGEDVDRLVLALDAQRRRVLGRRLLRDDRVPLFDEEARRDAVHRDAHRSCGAAPSNQSASSVGHGQPMAGRGEGVGSRGRGKLTDERLVLLLFAVGLAVQVDVDGVDDGQVVELEALTPEAQLVLLLAGRARVHRLVQPQLAKVPGYRRRATTFA